MRKLLAVLVGLILAASLAYVCRDSLLRTAGNVLVVRDLLERSDLIFVFGGHYDVREPAAARLFKEGWAPLIVFAREPDSDRPGVANFSNTTVSILKAEGVPENHIVEIPFGVGARSTADEARALRMYVNSHPVRRVILVTSWYHCR
ncbi:MAG: YdcF family protein, partial [Bryobacteraceae bacterium]